MNALHIFPYKDELAYSLFSRYSVKRGYISFASIAEELFVNSKCRPNIELCNQPNSQMYKQLSPIEAFLAQHTMLNYYLAFLPPNKQSTLRTLAEDMDIKSLSNRLPFPKSKHPRFLRFCPLCVKENREVYGEAYWNRAHQMHGISVCHKHQCKLLDSSVELSSQVPPMLIAAEETLGEEWDIIEPTSANETRLSLYAYQVLQTSTVSENAIGSYLSKRLMDTSYVSHRGVQRNISELTKDFLEYYKGMDLLGFGQNWQIEKVFSNQRINPFEICLLGMFLNISPEELVKRNADEGNNIVECFDRNIHELRKQGLNYREIAETVGMSYDYVKSIGNGSRGRYSYPRKQGTKKSALIKWKKLDTETLPKVKRLIAEMTAPSDNRPKRVSHGYVERTLCLKEGQLSKLPNCKSYVQEHTISQAEHWALTIAWAVRKLRKERISIGITSIQRLTNIRRSNIDKALPYLYRYFEEEDITLLQRCFDR